MLGRVFSVSCQLISKTLPLAVKHARGWLLVQCGCSVTEQRLPAAKQELARFLSSGETRSGEQELCIGQEDRAEGVLVMKWFTMRG